MRLAAILLALASLPAPALACGHPGDSTPTLFPDQDHPEFGLAAAGIYVFTDCIDPACGGVRHFVYMEENGWAGLQRLDAWDDDTWGGCFPPDRQVA